MENNNISKYNIGFICISMSFFATLIACGSINGKDLGSYIFGESLPYGIISLFLWYKSIMIGKRDSNNVLVIISTFLSKAMLLLFVLGVVLTIILSILG